MLPVNQQVAVMSQEATGQKKTVQTKPAFQIFMCVDSFHLSPLLNLLLNISNL